MALLIILFFDNPIWITIIFLLKQLERAFAGQQTVKDCRARSSSDITDTGSLTWPSSHHQPSPNWPRPSRHPPAPNLMPSCLLFSLNALRRHPFFYISLDERHNAQWGSPTDPYFAQLKVGDFALFPTSKMCRFYQNNDSNMHESFPIHKSKLICFLMVWCPDAEQCRFVTRQLVWNSL